MPQPPFFASGPTAARSFLISPAPIGLGTANAESLCSYFYRVAAHNGQTPGQMIFGGWTKRMARENPDVAGLRQTGRASFGHRTLSVSKAGQEFASALARLVGRPEVRVLHWETAMSGFSFARFTRAWDACCPFCLRSDAEPISRMIWEIAQVVACETHERRLISACPGCGKVARRIGMDGQILRCLHCNRDRREFDSARATKCEIATAVSVGKLVAEVTQSYPPKPISASACISHLLSWASAQGFSSIKQQTKFFGLSQGAISLWRHQATAPSLARVIELSIAKGVPLAALLRADLTGWPFQTAKTERSSAWGRKRINTSDRVDVVARLAAFSDRAPPRPLAEIAAKLGVTTRTLRILDPAVCAGITVSYATDRRRLKAAKLAWFCSKVDAYIAKCLAERRSPNLRGLAGAFVKPGQLREAVRRRYARHAIDRAQRLLPLPEQLDFSFLQEIATNAP